MAVRHESAAPQMWLHDDSAEDLVGADWHQRAIRTLSGCLLHLAAQRGWPWHVGDQLVLVGWKPDGTRWRPSPDIMVHPAAGPAEREEMSVRNDGPPALIVEVASVSTWDYDVDTVAGKAAGYANVGVPEYLVFDPTTRLLGASCRGWRRVEGGVEDWQPTATGAYHSTALSIAFRPDGPYLRVLDPEGQPVPYAHELAQAVAARDQLVATRDREIAALRAELAHLRGEGQS